ncbi:hypothetical protein DB88DRAFT_470370 [Papiliotrema laurentii]|uniref:Uncharacterized protein n=1 Tax=Papiliotrema laurentii TaxID=5418 RepID=A0AAD9FWX6_PAPLA|nr:hypothetical protein DB88DRAFT_470370 [Papiliotrema laurentii]
MDEKRISVLVERKQDTGELQVRSLTHGPTEVIPGHSGWQCFNDWSTLKGKGTQPSMLFEAFLRRSNELEVGAIKCPPGRDEAAHRSFVRDSHQEHRFLHRVARQWFEQMKHEFQGVNDVEELSLKERVSNRLEYIKACKLHGGMYSNTFKSPDFIPPEEEEAYSDTAIQTWEDRLSKNDPEAQQEFLKSTADVFDNRINMLVISSEARDQIHPFIQVHPGPGLSGETLSHAFASPSLPPPGQGYVVHPDTVGLLDDTEVLTLSKAFKGYLDTCRQHANTIKESDESFPGFFAELQAQIAELSRGMGEVLKARADAVDLSQDEGNQFLRKLRFFRACEGFMQTSHGLQRLSGTHEGHEKAVMDKRMDDLSRQIGEVQSSYREWLLQRKGATLTGEDPSQEEGDPITKGSSGVPGDPPGSTAITTATGDDPKITPIQRTSVAAMVPSGEKTKQKKKKNKNKNKKKKNDEKEKNKDNSESGGGANKESLGLPFIGRQLQDTQFTIFEPHSDSLQQENLGAEFRVHEPSVPDPPLTPLVSKNPSAGIMDLGAGTVDASRMKYHDESHVSQADDGSGKSTKVSVHLDQSIGPHSPAAAVLSAGIQGVHSQSSEPAETARYFQGTSGEIDPVPERTDDAQTDGPLSEGGQQPHEPGRFSIAFGGFIVSGPRQRSTGAPSPGATQSSAHEGHSEKPVRSQKTRTSAPMPLYDHGLTTAAPHQPLQQPRGSVSEADMTSVSPSANLFTYVDPNYSPFQPALEACRDTATGSTWVSGSAYSLNDPTFYPYAPYPPYGYYGFYPYDPQTYLGMPSQPWHTPHGSFYSPGPTVVVSGHTPFEEQIMRAASGDTDDGSQEGGDYDQVKVARSQQNTRRRSM